MSKRYDAIIVGARCAGSPAAMLLARRGYRVLLVDRATFPSDSMSTHIVHPPGVAALERFGLARRVEASGCPPVERYAFDFGPLTVAGSPRPVDGVRRALCPRRIVLDEILVEAAVEAGAELREGFTVDELLTEDGRVTGIGGHRRDGEHLTERAQVVVGADGRHSLVAKAVRAERYHERPTLECGYYAYWSNLPTDGLEIGIRPGRSWAAAPTNDGLTMVVVTWPRAEFEANRGDLERHYLETLRLDPAFGERIAAAGRETRFVGTGDLPNFFRVPHGPGWALVGDAGYHKDPCTAQGISDAFRDAEALAAALDQAFAGRASMADSLADYQRARDEASLPMFELTCEMATLEPPPPEMQRLLAATQGNPEAMDTFVSVIAGTVPVAEFFGAATAA